MGDGGDGNLDCHNGDTEWQLLGCYRQEMYNTIEQLSKHIWSYDDEDYETACSSLQYMTKYDCQQVGYDSSGNVVYAGIKPLEGGYFQMALYTDSNCLSEDTSGATYDDYYVNEETDDQEEGGGSGSQDQWWEYSGDYTMEGINEVMDGFKYCTLCMDYPTYQDGEENDGDGYDDDNLINQCWKFWSHASYPCNTDCIALASSQGTILSVQYGSYAFGSSSVGSSSYSTGTSYATGGGGGSSSTVSKFEAMKCNAFLILSSVVFLTTFLSFGIARSSLPKSSEGFSGRSKISRRSRAPQSKMRSKSVSGKSRSKSRSKRMLDEDYEEDRNRRSKSSGRSHRSRSRRREKPSRSSVSRSERSTNKYDPPNIPERSSRRYSKTREGERRRRDDF